MKVLKFGGTSVGSAQRIKDVAALVVTRGKDRANGCDRDNDCANGGKYNNCANGCGRDIVVLSAMSGTTNSLVEIGEYIRHKNLSGARDCINALEAKYRDVVAELYSSEEFRAKAAADVKARFDCARKLVKESFTDADEKELLSQGELMSTAMMHQYMQERGIKSVLLPALDFMRLDMNAEADMHYLSSRLCPLLDKHPEAEVFITQGFICMNAHNEVDNLQRGGSDLTASLIGAAIDAEEIEIWTDIDGMHNNDPRYVENTSPLRRLHFEEAAELAYFGAKILHPTCVLPAKHHGIPVRLLNTMQPDAPGTLIDNTTGTCAIKAVAAKDNITAIKIKSGRMLLAYGFLRKVFEIFETYKTPIDMITTSEVGVSVTIDNTKHLHEITNELKKLGTVTVDEDMVIICIVGDLKWENLGFESAALHALKDIPVRMISYGGSNYNISVLVRQQDKTDALRKLSHHLFKASKN